jgi:hypothetical protein
VIKNGQKVMKSDQKVMKNDEKVIIRIDVCQVSSNDSND